MHFKCFKSATSIKHVCVLFSSYLLLGITPLIFNMGSMLKWSANRPATNLAYMNPRTISHGIQIVHFEQLNE